MHNTSAKFSAPGVRGTLLYVYLMSGQVDVSFGTLEKLSAFADPERRLELLEKLNALPGVVIPPEKLALWPAVPLQSLAGTVSREQFFGAMKWMLEEVNLACGE